MFDIDLKARAQANGNSLHDMFDVYHDIQTIIDEIDILHGKLRAMVVHPRNYQHMPVDKAEDAVINDRRKVYEVLTQARYAIGSLSSAIADVVDISENI